MVRTHLIIPSFSSQHVERFWTKVNICAPNKCWPWLGYCNRGGYGVCSLQGWHSQAHRIVYRIAKGPVPRGLCVLHHCDNRKCCNPKHLFLGTLADNVRDMDNKKRRIPAAGDFNGSRTCPESRPRGEKQWSARLKTEQIKQIRNFYKTNLWTQKAIAEKFGVTESCICHIIARRSWKHIF